MLRPLLVTVKEMMMPLDSPEIIVVTSLCFTRFSLVSLLLEEPEPTLNERSPVTVLGQVMDEGQLPLKVLKGVKG
jgi:hypothetical protein